MQEKGWSKEAAQYTAGLYKWVREGKETDPDPELATLLDRPPRRFTEFATDYRKAWLG